MVADDGTCAGKVNQRYERDITDMLLEKCQRYEEALRYIATDSGMEEWGAAADYAKHVLEQALKVPSEAKG